MSDLAPPQSNDLSDQALRKIIHIDMDAFFASVEQRDNPELRGKPVAVGGSARRGVVAAASYEARQFGVHSAMPSVTAKRLCPALIFVPHRFEQYKAVSRQIHQIFSRYSDLVEPLSLDEAYLDVSADKGNIGSATNTAERIRADILFDTQLTASAGVSYNKFLAKIASDQNKPDGLCVITPQRGSDFVSRLPVKKFYGVGPKTAKRMNGLGLHTGADLRALDMDAMTAHFGKMADYLYRACRGIDHRPVHSNRIRKSIGGERTYSEDLRSQSELEDALRKIVDMVWQRIEHNRAQGRTITLKVKFADFKQITRAKTCPEYVADRSAFSAIASELLDAVMPVKKGVRLLGLTLSGLKGSNSPHVNEPKLNYVAEQKSFDF
ncbi:MAG: DNA polymerase IV [Pseudomonadota bacterium]